MVELAAGDTFHMQVVVAALALGELIDEIAAVALDGALNLAAFHQFLDEPVYSTLARGFAHLGVGFHHVLYFAISSPAFNLRVIFNFKLYHITPAMSSKKAGFNSLFTVDNRQRY